MRSKMGRLAKNRTEAVVAALAIVMSIAAGSAALAQDSSTKPSAPASTDKPADRVDMGGCGGGKMGKMADMQGMMEGCKRMMGHSGDASAEKKQDEKK